MTTSSQRWRARRESWVAPGPLFTGQGFTVARVPWTEARRFVVAHHYSASWPSVVLAYGLWQDRGPVWAPELVGVLTFGIPAQVKALSTHLGDRPGLELSRLVLLDEVPGNAESWFTARAMKAAHREKGYAAFLSYADPHPRSTPEGRVITPGHVGVVYQALNADYRGQTGRRTYHFTPSGVMLQPRTLSKIRGEERGADGAVRQLIALGLPAPRLSESGPAYLTRIRPLLRAERLPGKHTYVLALKATRGTLPYPKKHKETPCP